MIYIIAIILFGFSSSDPVGSWKGTMNVMGNNLELIFHVKADGDGYSATMDSPMQGLTGFPAASVSYENDKLQINFPKIMATYVGTLKDDAVTGNWMQGGQTFTMNLEKFTPEKKEVTKVENLNTDFIGSWEGKINVRGNMMRLRLNISETEVSMESPDQGGGKMMPSGHTFEATKAKIDFSAMAADFKLDLKDGMLVGSFNQVGQKYDIKMSKVK